MFNIDKKKINSILEYVVIILLVIISLSKGGYYKRDAIIGISVINVIFVIKCILNLKEARKINLLNYILLFFSFTYYIPIILSTTATISGSINAFFKVFTMFVIFCIVQNSENKEKFKNGILVSGIIIGILGIDELTFKMLDIPLKALGSGYIEGTTKALSSVIQYANITGMIFVVSSLLVLEKITNNRKKVEKSGKKDKRIIDQIKLENIKIAEITQRLLSKEGFLNVIYLFLVIVTFLTQSKMAIILLVTSSIIYKIIHREYKDLIIISAFLVIGLLFSLDNLFRFKEYFSTLDSTKTRLVYYIDALKLWTTNISTIFFGQGGNAFRMLYETVQESGYVSMEVHSLFIQVLLESGICGLVSLLFIIIYSLVKGKDNNAKLILATLCIFAAFDVFFTYTYMLFLLAIVIALCNIYGKETKKWQNIINLVISSIVTIYSIKISLGYILEPIDVENANITLIEQEKKIHQCERALSFDPWDMDIREKYTKACTTYLEMMDIKKQLYSEDNDQKRGEIVSKLYTNVLKEIENETNNKYAIDDYMKVTTKYVDYLVSLNYESSIEEGYEYYLEDLLNKSNELEEKHKYNEVSKIINRNNLKDIYIKYEELNYILNSQKIEQVLDIIKEKENINL